MKRVLAFVLIQTVLRILNRMPVAWLHALGPMSAKLIQRRGSNKDRIIHRNLEIAFRDWDDQSKASLKQQSSIHTACFALETGLIWHGNGVRVDQAISQVLGWDHVESAMASGKGLLLVGAHLGNWELLNLYCMRQLSMAGLYKAPSDSVFNQWIRSARERFGGQLIASGSQSMRQLLRTLRSGGAAGIIADQQPKLGDGVMAPFFGHPALTMTLIGRLANKTGCHVLMASCYRVMGKGFRIEIRPVDASITDSDPVIAATALNASIEQAIRVAPEQYLWRYPRFSSDQYQA